MSFVAADLFVSSDSVLTETVPCNYYNVILYYVILCCSILIIFIRRRILRAYRLEGATENAGPGNAVRPFRGPAFSCYCYFVVRHFSGPAPPPHRRRCTLDKFTYLHTYLLLSLLNSMHCCNGVLV